MPIDLDELEKLEKEATPGPWSKAFVDGELWVADRDLICQMRNALPEMIEEIRHWRDYQTWAKALQENEQICRDHFNSMLKWP